MWLGRSVSPAFSVQKIDTSPRLLGQLSEVEIRLSRNRQKRLSKCGNVQVLPTFSAASLDKKTNNPNPSPAEIRFGLFFFGTPEGTRTPDLLIRSQSLYPTELLAHTHFSQTPEYNTTSLEKLQVLFSLFPTFLSSPPRRLDSLGISGVKCPP